ncbi:MAG: RNA methyltransferase [Candidatus Marinimicrobia bacterium]|nr:RNA methyltransferase [Candidatus Neomarinimicrobiota bacterium]
MLSSVRIKQLKSLHQKKFRRQENHFLLEGNRLISQALSADAPLIEVWMTQKNMDSDFGRNNLQKFEEKKIPFSVAPDKIIRQMSDSLNDQGIIALTPIPIYEKYDNPPSKAIYLDGISDPGNMGTILRTAAWFGIKSIFRTPECVDPFNSKVVRSAMGAHFYFSHFDAIPEEKILGDYTKAGMEILGADMNGSPIQSLNLEVDKRWILILGNEAHGIGELAQTFITSTISIPGIDGMESLNVSVAGGILLYTLTS